MSTVGSDVDLKQDTDQPIEIPIANLTEKPKEDNESKEAAELIPPIIKIIKDPKSTPKDIENFLASFYDNLHPLKRSWFVQGKDEGNTAIHLAILSRRFELINPLLKLSVALTEDRNCSAFRLDICNDHKMHFLNTSIAELEEDDCLIVLNILLESDHSTIGDLLTKSDWREIYYISCLELAIEKRKFQVVQKLLKSSKLCISEHEPYHAAVKTDCITVLPLLNASERFSINYFDKRTALSPLMLAVQLGKTELVHALLLCPLIDINAKNRIGDTALHVAVRVKPINKEIIGLLLKHGGDLELSNLRGITPLKIATENGCKEIILGLLKTETGKAAAEQGQISEALGGQLKTKSMPSLLSLLGPSQTRVPLLKKALVDLRLFAHINNDHMLQGFAEQGNNIEITAQYALEVITAILEGRINLLDIESVSAHKSLEFFQDKLKELIALNEEFEALKLEGLTRSGIDFQDRSRDYWKKEKKELLSKLVQSLIGKLKTRKSILIPGGWYSRTIGHAMLYDFEILSDGSILVSIYNSGAGITFHEKLEGAKDKYSACFRFKIPKKHAEQLPTFLIELLNEKFASFWEGSDGDEHREKSIYSLLYKYILLCDAELTSNRDTSKYITMQRSGTCAWKAIDAWLVSIAERSIYTPLKFEFKYQSILEFFVDRYQTGIFREHKIALLFQDGLQNFARLFGKILENSAQKSSRTPRIPQDILMTLENIDRAVRLEDKARLEELQLQLQTPKHRRSLPLAQAPSLAEGLLDYEVEETCSAIQSSGIEGIYHFYSRDSEKKETTEGLYQYDTKLSWSEPHADIKALQAKIESFKHNYQSQVFILKAIEQWMLEVPMGLSIRSGESAHQGDSTYPTPLSLSSNSSYWESVKLRSEMLELMKKFAEVQRSYLFALSQSRRIPFASQMVTLLSFIALATKLAMKFYPEEGFKAYHSLYKPVLQKLYDNFIHKPSFYIDNGFVDERFAELEDWFRGLAFPAQNDAPQKILDTIIETRALDQSELWKLGQSFLQKRLESYKKPGVAGLRVQNLDMALLFEIITNSPSSLPVEVIEDYEFLKLMQCLFADSLFVLQYGYQEDFRINSEKMDYVVHSGYHAGSEQGILNFELSFGDYAKHKEWEPYLREKKSITEAVSQLHSLGINKISFLERFEFQNKYDDRPIVLETNVIQTRRPNEKLDRKKAEMVRTLHSRVVPECMPTTTFDLLLSALNLLQDIDYQSLLKINLFKPRLFTDRLNKQVSILQNYSKLFNEGCLYYKDGDHLGMPIHHLLKIGFVVRSYLSNFQKRREYGTITSDFRAGEISLAKDLEKLDYFLQLNNPESRALSKSHKRLAVALQQLLYYNKLQQIEQDIVNKIPDVNTVKQYLIAYFYISAHNVGNEDPIEQIDPLLLNSLANLKFFMTPVVLQLAKTLQVKELCDLIEEALPTTLREKFADKNNRFKVVFPEVSFTDKEGEEYHVNLIDYTFRKGSFEYRSIPAWIRKLDKFQALFGDVDLGIVLVNSEGIIEFPYLGSTYRIWPKSEDKATFYKLIKVQDSQSWYQFFSKPDPRFESLPAYLMDRNYHFWLDLETDGKGSRSVVFSDVNTGENCYYVKRTQIFKLHHHEICAEVLTTKGHVKGSKRRLLECLNRLDDDNFIEVIRQLSYESKEGENLIIVKFHRYNLSFQLKKNRRNTYSLVSLEYPQYELNLDPVTNLISGFSSYLQLDPNSVEIVESAIAESMDELRSFTVVPKQTFVSIGPNKIDLDKEGIYIGDELLMAVGNPKYERSHSSGPAIKTLLKPKDWSFRGQCEYFKIPIKRKTKLLLDEGRQPLNNHCLLEPQTSEESLFLSYIAVSTHNFGAAFEYFNQFRSGAGFVGSAFEAKLIRWFLEAIPYQVQSQIMRAKTAGSHGIDSENIIETPALLALRAALLVDVLKFLSAQMSFQLRDLSDNDVLNNYLIKDLKNYYTIPNLRPKIRDILYKHDQTQKNIGSRYKLSELDRSFLNSFLNPDELVKKNALHLFEKTQLPVLLPKLKKIEDDSPFLYKWRESSYQYVGSLIRIQDLRKKKKVKNVDLITSFLAYFRFARGERVSELQITDFERDSAIRMLKNWLVLQVREKIIFERLGLLKKTTYTTADSVKDLELTGDNCKDTLMIILLYVLEYPELFARLNCFKKTDYGKYIDIPTFIEQTRRLSESRPVCFPIYNKKPKKVVISAKLSKTAPLPEREVTDIKEREIDLIKIEVPSVHDCLRSAMKELSITKEIPRNQDEALRIMKHKTADTSSTTAASETSSDMDLKDYQEGKRQNELIRQFKSETFALLSNKTLIDKLEAQCFAVISAHAPKLDALQIAADKLVNALPKEEHDSFMAKLKHLGQEQHTIPFSDIMKHFLKGTKAQTLFPFGSRFDALQKQLLSLFIEYLLTRTALQHHERVFRAIQAYKKDPQNLGKLSDVLFAERVYLYREMPQRLAFEEAENILIRESQHKMLGLTSAKSKNGRRFISKVFQLMMGQGKTTVIVPISAEENMVVLHDDNLVLQLVPKALLKTQCADLRKTSKRSFDQAALPLQFNRNCPDSFENLSWLLNYLKYAIEYKDYQVCSNTDAPSIELKWLEMLDKKELDEKAIYAIEEILELIEENVDAFIDEGDSLLDIRKELNYTVDTARNLRSETIASFLDVYALFDKVKFQRFDTQKKCFYGKEYHLSDVYASRKFPDMTYESWQYLFENVIAHKFAEVLIDDPSSFLKPIITKIRKADPGNQKGFMEELRAYIKAKVTGKLKGIKTEPPFLSNSDLSEDDKDALAICKDLLKNLLPQTLRKKAGKNYGRPTAASVKQNGLIDNEVACPYIANKIPSPNSQFASPYETLCYTIQMNKIRGISREMFKEFIARLQHNANEAKQFSQGAITSVDDTEAGHIFRKLTGLTRSLSSINLNDEKTVHELYHTLKLRKKPEVIDYVLKHHILPRIKINPRILRHNALNHSSMYASFRTCSGTILSPFIFDERAEFDEESAFGVDGRTIDHLLQQNPKVAVHVAASISPFESLKNILQNRDNMRALIDVGAYFYGIGNIKVAKWLSNFYASEPNNRFNMKYILYYNKDDVLCALKVGTKVGTDGKLQEKPIKLTSSDPIEIRKILECGPEQCFTYYDELRATGTNLPQMTNAQAIVTIGTQTMRKDFLQGVMRMRDLAGTHRIEVLVPKNMHEAMVASMSEAKQADKPVVNVSDKAETKTAMESRTITAEKGTDEAKTWDTQRVLSVTHEIQKQRVAEDNYRAALFKIKDLVRREGLRLLRREKNIQKKKAIFEVMKPLLFTVFKDAPFENFGAIETEVFTMDVLNEERKHWSDFWKKICNTAGVPIEGAALKSFEEKLDIILSKAEKVCAKTVLLQNEMQDAAVETLAATSTQQAALVNVNQASQREAMREASFLNYSPDVDPMGYKPWPEQLDLINIDLFKPDYSRQVPLSSPRLFQLNEVLGVNTRTPDSDVKVYLRRQFLAMNRVKSATSVSVTDIAPTFEFSPDISLSENYRYTTSFRTHSLESQFFSPYVKPAHYGLFIQDDKKNTLKLIVITQDEAGQFERIFAFQDQVRRLAAPSRSKFFWILSPNGLHFAGIPPRKLHESFSSLLEQFWYLNADTHLFAKNIDKLKWFRIDLLKKLDYYDRIVLFCHPDRYMSFPYLKKLLLGEIKPPSEPNPIRTIAQVSASESASASPGMLDYYDSLSGQQRGVAGKGLDKAQDKGQTDFKSSATATSSRDTTASRQRFL